MSWWPELSVNNPRIIKLEIQKLYGKYCIFATLKSGLTYSVSSLLTFRQGKVKLDELKSGQ